MCCWNVSPWLTGLKAGPATHSGSELTADTALTADTEASAYRAQRTLRVADTGPQRTLRVADTGPQRTLRLADTGPQRTLRPKAAPEAAL
jgi:hypothetical protein